MGALDASLGTRKVNRVSSGNAFILELLAVYQALVDLGDSKITVLSDSQWVVDVLTGDRRKTRKARLGQTGPIIDSVHKLCANRDVVLKYVSRKENKAGWLLEE